MENLIFDALLNVRQHFINLFTINRIDGRNRLLSCDSTIMNNHIVNGCIRVHSTFFIAPVFPPRSGILGLLYSSSFTLVRKIVNEVIPAQIGYIVMLD